VKDVRVVRALELLGGDGGGTVGVHQHVKKKK